MRETGEDLVDMVGDGKVVLPNKSQGKLVGSLGEVGGYYFTFLFFHEKNFIPKENKN